MKVLNPAGEAEQIGIAGLEPRVTDLAGKRILLWNNTKGGADVLLPVIQELVVTRFPTAKVVSWRMSYHPTPQPEAYKQVKDKCDVAIVAIGD